LCQKLFRKCTSKKFIFRKRIRKLPSSSTDCRLKETNPESPDLTLPGELIRCRRRRHRRRRRKRWTSRSSSSPEALPRSSRPSSPRSSAEHDTPPLAPKALINPPPPLLLLAGRPQGTPPGRKPPGDLLRPRPPRGQRPQGHHRGEQATHFFYFFSEAWRYSLMPRCVFCRWWRGKRRPASSERGSLVRPMTASAWR
jgi:hypothetical protein